MEIGHNNQEVKPDKFKTPQRPTTFQESHSNSHDFEKIDSVEISPRITTVADAILPPSLYTNHISPTSRREETYLEKIKNIGTNLRFNFESLGQNKWLFEGDKGAGVYLLGEKYDFNVGEIAKLEKLKEIKARFAKIIWFTYRKNFPKLNHKKLPMTETYISDNGWGCMIRVCQMIFAECLKRCYVSKQLRNNKEDNEGAADMDSKSLNLRVISWFLDCEVNPVLSPYSIQNLSSYLFKNFQTLPGVWLKPSLLLFALQKIHKDLGQYTLPDLDMEIYLEGTVYLSQALKKMASLKSLEDESTDNILDSEFEIIEDDFQNKPVSNKKPAKRNIRHKEMNLRKSSSEGHSFDSAFLDDPKDLDRLLRHKWKKSLVLFVLAKIGLERPNPEYIPFIKELLSYPESVGMIGGKPGLAYYIVGFSNDQLIYLDPHFVQDATPSRKDLEENSGSYTCENMRHMAFGSLDTSVAFGFFIQDETSFKEFVTRFKQSCEKKESFLGIEMNSVIEDSGDFESFGEEEEEFEMIYVK